MAPLKKQLRGLIQYASTRRKRKLDELEKENLVSGQLEHCSIHFATRSLRFMDAYHKGLNGKQAVWSAKKYRGHRVIPESILSELSMAGVE